MVLEGDRKANYFNQKYQDSPNSLFIIPIADMKVNRGLADEAIELLNAHSEIINNNLSAMLVLAKAQEAIGDVSKAKKIFENIQALDPGNKYVTKKLNEMTVASSSVEPDVEIIQPPKADDTPKNVEIQSPFLTMTVADIYLAQGYKNKAIEILEKIITKNPDRTDIVEKLNSLKNSGELNEEK